MPNDTETAVCACWNTGIVLVNCQFPDTSEENSGSLHGPLILELMVQRVTKTLDKPETEFVSSGIKVDSTPYLGKTIADDRGRIQSVRGEHLLPESKKVICFPSRKTEILRHSALTAVPDFMRYSSSN